MADMHSDPIAAADALAPEIRERASEIEANRFLPQDLAAKFAEAGLYRLCIPATYGGLETSPDILCRTIERVARADGSAAWCVMIASTTGLVAAFLPPEDARAVFGDPMTICAGVFAPRGKAARETRDGVAGYRVNGQWQWGSGSRNARWIMGGCLILDDAGKPLLHSTGTPQSRMMIADSADVDILDTWHVSGLCGTGSNDFAIRDLFIPQGRSVDLVADRPLERPLYAFPTFGILAMGIASVALGLGRAAIDEVLAIAHQKTPQGSSKALGLKPAAQTDVAEAEALLRSARAFFYETLAESWDAAQGKGAITVEHRRDLRLAATHATRSAARAVDLMYTLAGGTSVYRSSPLQRIFRDIHVATQHMMVNAATLELTGRLFLGVETNVDML